MMDEILLAGADPFTIAFFAKMGFDFLGGLLGTDEKELLELQLANQRWLLGQQLAQQDVHHKDRMQQIYDQMQAIQRDQQISRQMKSTMHDEFMCVQERKRDRLLQYANRQRGEAAATWGGSGAQAELEAVAAEDARLEEHGQHRIAQRRVAAENQQGEQAGAGRPYQPPRIHGPAPERIRGAYAPPARA